MGNERLLMLDLFDRSPPGAVDVIKTQDQKYATLHWSIDLKIGFGAEKNITRLRVKISPSEGSNVEPIEELFCKQKDNEEWLYYGSDVGNPVQTVELKVRAYLMERYNLDIDWDGKMPNMAEFIEVNM